MNLTPSDVNILAKNSFWMVVWFIEDHHIGEENCIRTYSMEYNLNLGLSVGTMAMCTCPYASKV